MGQENFVQFVVNGFQALLHQGVNNLAKETIEGIIVRQTC